MVVIAVLTNRNSLLVAVFVTYVSNARHFMFHLSFLHYRRIMRLELNSVQLTSSCIKTGERRIIRLDELSRLVRLHRRTKRFSSSRRIMRLSRVFIRDEVN